MTKKQMAEMLKGIIEGATNKELEKIVEKFEAEIKNEILNNHECKLLTLGTFKVKERAARIGRNPSNGETLEIAASKAVTFKASASLKTSVNE